jgi:hypothetical protein
LFLETDLQAVLTHLTALDIYFEGAETENARRSVVFVHNGWCFGSVSFGLLKT